MKKIKVSIDGSGGFGTREFYGWSRNEAEREINKVLGRCRYVYEGRRCTKRATMTSGMCSGRPHKP